MQHRPLGSSGLQVSRLGLGTMAWGRDVEWPQARDLLRDFVDAGGTLVDTAPAYGAGVAEKMVGKALAGGLPREALVIATKAGFVIRDGRRVIDTSRGALLSDLEQSLRRLGTDHVDLWQVHAWGDAPLEETLSALDSAVARGMARYVGVSNFVGWQTATAATWQDADRARTPISSVQVEYSLLARRAEVEVVPAARHHRLGLLAWSALGRGALTGKYRGGRLPRDSRAASDHFGWFLEPYLQPRSAAIVDAVAHAAQGLGLTPGQVALMWVRDAPQVASALVGPRTTDQLAELLDAEDKTLVPPIVSALDDISGGANAYR
ncbi:aldo/keto reductase [Tessaracoccus lapidicaptus]|uniref:Aldo/keto reductase n=1 Tax=Tessaracoccus lapidicaptus TaxID=1427523 RepID=A0A1C0AGP4_9ACTN|nr:MULTISPECIES: aldo/keto reductase [Tessaracoccus]AQX14948.1 aldo/keto reductase [Tessaracoccus sp. T2.5-30]OCL30852.1 aldo/keto reductase [Tessaracoccus lapidicaptus]VEP39114.1 General stress protein 69 [Tessaracoccus lapidicaptus]